MKANPTSPKKSPPSPKPKRLRIYIGPNSRELGIFTYMRFRGDYPEHVVAALAENPALENYFVEFETAGEPSAENETALPLHLETSADPLEARLAFPGPLTRE
jgi:hypothetical protein